MKLYEVGGHIRDGLLGLESKDVDYTVVINSEVFKNTHDAFTAMVEALKAQKFKVFLETEEFLTVRAMFPEDHEHSGVADFVLARKEHRYSTGTRKPIVTVGTLMDDLIRRDLTVNAMARDLDGTLIDPFNGAKDLKDMIMRTPGDAAVSFNDDPLRILRVLRFSVTKSFGFSDQIINAIKSFDFRKMIAVSDERLLDELHKMFKYDTFNSFKVLRNLQDWNPQLFVYIMTRDNFWLEPTCKR